MKVVFLHGIGDGDPDYSWLDGLNRGLEQAGYATVEREQVIAPRYSRLLKSDEHDGQRLPPTTYRAKDDQISRRAQRRVRIADGEVNSS